MTYIHTLATGEMRLYRRHPEFTLFSKILDGFVGIKINQTNEEQYKITK